MIIQKSLNLKSSNTENHQEVKQSRRTRTEQTAELPQHNSPATAHLSAEQPNQTLTGLEANCQVQCTAQWKQASKVVTDAKSCCLLRRNLTLCDRRFRWF